MDIDHIVVSLIILISIKMGVLSIFQRYVFCFVRNSLDGVLRWVLDLFEFLRYEPKMTIEIKRKGFECLRNSNPLVRDKNQTGTVLVTSNSDASDLSSPFSYGQLAFFNKSKARSEDNPSNELSTFCAVKPNIYQKCQRKVCSSENDISMMTRILKNTVGDVFEFASIFGHNAHEMLIQKYEKYGPIYTFSAFGKQMVFLFEVDDIEKLKSAEGRCPRHLDFKHLRRHREDQGYPKGLLVSDGDDWLRQRRILSNPLMLKTGHHFIHIDELVTGMISRIVSKHLLNGQASLPVSLITRDFSIDAFGTVLYGNSFQSTFTEDGKVMQQFAELAKNNFEDAKKLMITPEWLMKLHPAWERHNNRWNILLKTTIDMIEKHTRDVGDDSILSSLLKTRTLTDKEIFINLTDLLVASIDTTNTTLQWCLYELACHPEAQVGIITEAERLLEGKTKLIKSDVDNHRFLKAVLWETLRLHPVGFFTSRIIQNDMDVRGMTIPKQTNVAISMYVMGRNPMLFPHPNEFHPERWLSDNAKIRKFPQDVFFGFGPRMCLGRKIAEMEILLFLLKFCLEFEFTTADKDISQIVKLLLSPSRSIEITVKRRRKQN